MCLAIPGEIVAIRDEQGVRFGTVRFAGITRDICLACVPEADVGAYVLAHVGFAIAVIDAEEAARAYRLLAELGDESEPAIDGEDVEKSPS